MPWVQALAPEGTLGYIQSVGLPFASLALIGAIAIEVGGGAPQFQPGDAISAAEDQAQGRDPCIDQVGAEQVGPAGPGQVGDAHALRPELDRDRREIELEVAADLHLPRQPGGQDALQRSLEEAPLGDEEYQPQGKDDADDPQQDACRQRQTAPALPHAAEMHSRAARQGGLGRAGRHRFDIGHGGVNAGMPPLGPNRLLLRARPTMGRPSRYSVRPPG